VRAEAMDAELPGFIVEFADGQVGDGRVAHKSRAGGRVLRVDQGPDPVTIDGEQPEGAGLTGQPQV
jgi:hypothetical protein